MLFPCQGETQVCWCPGTRAQIKHGQRLGLKRGDPVTVRGQCGVQGVLRK